MINTLRAAKPSNLEWIFISGFETSTKSELIMDYLGTHNLRGGCICIKMITRKDQYYSSFKLGVPPEKKQEVMSADLWPGGITLNHFQNLQRLSPRRSPLPQVLRT